MDVIMQDTTRRVRATAPRGAVVSSGDFLKDAGKVLRQVTRVSHVAVTDGHGKLVMVVSGQRRDLA